ncbi:MAG: TRL-like family protein [Candidatus Brocadiia bacterium]|jgi:hypothetical protein|nr:TRL-like family protein [Candidatus Brocadiia bacterium]
MRKIGKVLAVCLVLVMAVGCAFPYTAPVVPPVGSFFSQISAPISTDFNEATAVATKHGSASSSSVLWLVAFGDCSIDAAAEEGELSKIHYADYTYLNVLGFYQNFTVTVHGE